MQSLFAGSAIPVLEQVVQFSQARHNVLAGNIANMDTPGYRTRDLSVTHFQDQLKHAIDERDRQPPPSLGQQIAGGGIDKVRYEDPVSGVSQGLSSILYHDDSDVSLENQIAEIAKNHQMHNTALAILTNQFRLLQTAISERV